MIEHSKSARLGIKNSLMVVDMPYRTYINKKIALKNAKRILKETKCDAVKLEGGSLIINVIEHLIKNKIPVMGHLGILPQSVKGKFKFKGKKNSERKKIFNDSRLLEKTGVFSIVLECVESTLAKKISKKLKIPTIGIGSSKFCDGQILVIDDLIGLNDTKVRFVKKFGQIKKNISKAAKNFSRAVKNKKYPSKIYSY